MIKSIKLTNFRQFSDTKFNFDKNIVVILGKNTKGKSTILESIYYLTNGYSPWSENGDIVSYDNEYFRIDADIEDGNADTVIYSIFKDSNKRHVQIEKKNTTPKKYFSKISSTLFSPELIEILLVSPSKRRDFIDHFCSTLDTEYKAELDKYRKILRQRNGYIKRLSKILYETGHIPNIDNQFTYWTHLLAQSSAKLLFLRLKYIEGIKDENFEVKYKSNIDFNSLEEILELKDIIEITEEKMIEQRKRDIAIGHSTTGVHRDDWDIIDGKDVKRYGSRGEKRLAIIKLIYRTHKVITKMKGLAPYLLLDDIPSELDDENIKKIFNKETFEKQQTFITAIRENEIPKEILKQACIITLTN